MMLMMNNNYDSDDVLRERCAKDICVMMIIFTPGYLECITNDKVIGLIIIITVIIMSTLPQEHMQLWAHKILEGISSLHSWIKTQTIIRWVRSLSTHVSH